MFSSGGHLFDDSAKNSLVAVIAEGKKHPLAIGQMKMDPAEIRNSNKGIAIDNVHYLG